jgi:hypothetical protein
MNIKVMKLYNWRVVLLIICILTAFYLLVLYPWMTRWGATDTELTMPLPGDGIVPVVNSQSTRAVTIHAPADEVWKWVLQIGQERAGFYSNDWLENLTLADIHNVNAIRPEWQSRQPGEVVLGAGGNVYGQKSNWHIQAYEDGKSLYLWGSITVIPVDAGTSRLLVRTRNAPSSLPVEIISKFSYDWMHFVMERGLLLGIKARAEGSLDTNPIPQIFSAIGWITASLGIAFVLFARHRGWWWGLIPLAYAVLIIAFTADIWSAMAGFLWWGILAAGFLSLGDNWWKGLVLVMGTVVSIFVVAPQPQIAFGILFLIITLAILFIKTNAIRSSSRLYSFFNLST